MKKGKKRKKRKNNYGFFWRDDIKYLLFLAVLSYFATKAKIYADMDRGFELICSRLVEEDVADMVTDFEKLCHEYKADVERMHDKFYEFFGMSGDEVVASLREMG